MAQVKMGDKVKVHYTGKFEDGTVFDSSENREPLQFTTGERQVIPGFEQAVIGMKPGESKTVTIPSDQAYGPRFEDAVFVVDRKAFPPELKPEVNQRLHLHHPSGREIPVVVTEVSESSITLDSNHPLAGKDLTFDIKLVEIG